MSNYPPGVSGNEWAIAGPSYERDEARTCGQEDVTLRTLSALGKRKIEESIEALATCPECRVMKYAHKMDCSQRGGPTTAPAAIRAFLTTALSEVEETVVPTCPLVDEEVTVWGGDDGLLHWTCPVCGHEHEEEPDDAGPYEPGDDL